MRPLSLLPPPSLLTQWNDFDLRRGSAEYRLYQLNSNMAEHLASGDVSPRVRARFKNFVMQLPIFPCTPLGVTKALTWSPLPNLKLDLGEEGGFECVS